MKLNISNGIITDLDFSSMSMDVTLDGQKMDILIDEDCNKVLSAIGDMRKNTEKLKKEFSTFSSVLSGIITPMISSAADEVIEFLDNIVTEIYNYRDENNQVKAEDSDDDNEDIDCDDDFKNSTRLIDMSETMSISIGSLIERYMAEMPYEVEDPDELFDVLHDFASWVYLLDR